MKKQYCKRNGCINIANKNQMIRDTPLCDECEQVIVRLIRMGTSQKWQKIQWQSQ